MQSAPKAPQMVLACRRRAHHLHVQGLARRASPQTPSGQPAFQLSQATRVRAMTFGPTHGYTRGPPHSPTPWLSILPPIKNCQRDNCVLC